LRHSLTTLLLNAGAPILMVQNLLDNKYVDTTLGYARLYDGTVAADYFNAVGKLEGMVVKSKTILYSALDPNEALSIHKSYSNSKYGHLRFKLEVSGNINTHL
jgi:hypothetical protein